jgi:hypothetical protein
VGNQPAVVVQGTASAASGGIKETLYIVSTGRPLPLRLIGHVPGERLRVMFGHWGEALHLAPPANSIPISSLTS